MILLKIIFWLSVVGLVRYTIGGILNFIHLRQLEKKGFVDEGGEYEGLLAMRNSKGFFLSLVTFAISGILLLVL